jgi:hypothetical protein
MIHCQFGRVRPQPAHRDEGAPLGFAGSMRCRTARRSLPAIIARPADITEATTPVRSVSKPPGSHAAFVLFPRLQSKPPQRKMLSPCSINGRGRQTNNVVGPQAMHKVREQSERRALAQWSHQSKREEVGWKSQRRKGLVEENEVAGLIGPAIVCLDEHSRAHRF